jgi:hypothetical protein
MSFQLSKRKFRENLCKDELKELVKCRISSYIKEEKLISEIFMYLDTLMS